METGDRARRRPGNHKYAETVKYQNRVFGRATKTTKPVLEVAEMVLSGSVNKFFVAELAKHGLRAAGISGKDGGLLEADYLDPETYGKSEKSKGRCIHGERADGKGIIPVIAPLSMTSDCKTLNVNADLVASAVAGALEADKLMFVTDVDGIMKESDVSTS